MSFINNYHQKKSLDYKRCQITRAAVSTASNIAEGCSRNSDKEFKRFLEITMGSLFEVETQLITSKKLEFIAE